MIFQILFSERNSKKVDLKGRWVAEFWLEEAHVVIILSVLKGLESSRQQLA